MGFTGIKSARDTKLQNMVVDITALATERRILMTAEALWLRTLQSTVGIGSLREANTSKATQKVTDGINNYLGG